MLAKKQKVESDANELNKLLISECKDIDYEEDRLGVPQLLALGADPKFFDESGKSALQSALSNEYRADVRGITLLLEHGADPNRHFSNGNTPLLELLPDPGHYFFGALQSGQTGRKSYGAAAPRGALRHKENTLEVLHLLLQHKADPNLAHGHQAEVYHYQEDDDSSEDKYDIENGIGRTPLMVAAHTRNINYVKLLLKNGADVNQTNAAGKTILELMEEEEPKIRSNERSFSEVVKLCTQYLVVKPKLK